MLRFVPLKQFPELRKNWIDSVFVCALAGLRSDHEVLKSSSLQMCFEVCDYLYGAYQTLLLL